MDTGLDLRGCFARVRAIQWRQNVLLAHEAQELLSAVMGCADVFLRASGSTNDSTNLNDAVSEFYECRGLETLTPVLGISAAQRAVRSQLAAGDRTEDGAVLGLLDRVGQEICAVLAHVLRNASHCASFHDLGGLPHLVDYLKRTVHADVSKSTAGGSPRRAADALRAVLAGGKDVRAMVLELGAMEPLVQLTVSGNFKVAAASLMALTVVLSGMDDRSRSLAIQARAVPNLLTLLHSAKPSLRLDALQCFHYLLRGGREERRAVLAHISPAALVQATVPLLLAAQPSWASRLAASVLGQLSSEPELSRKIAMRGAVPLLSNMLTHQVAMTRRTAAFCLGRLVADPDVKGAVVTLGALPRLINMLDGDNNLHAPAFVLSQLPASPDLALAVSRVGVLERMWELRQEGGASRDAGSCIARCIASTGAQLSSPDGVALAMRFLAEKVGQLREAAAALAAAPDTRPTALSQVASETWRAERGLAGALLVFTPWEGLCRQLASGTSLAWEAVAATLPLLSQASKRMSLGACFPAASMLHRLIHVRDKEPWPVHDSPWFEPSHAGASAVPRPSAAPANAPASAPASAPDSAHATTQTGVEAPSEMTLVMTVPEALAAAVDMVRARTASEARVLTVEAGGAGREGPGDGARPREARDSPEVERPRKRARVAGAEDQEGAGASPRPAPGGGDASGGAAAVAGSSSPDGGAEARGESEGGAGEPCVDVWVSGTRHRVPREALVGHSSFFRALLEGPFAEGAGNEVRLGEGSPGDIARALAMLGEIHAAGREGRAVGDAAGGVADWGEMVSCLVLADQWDVGGLKEVMERHGQCPADRGGRRGPALPRPGPGGASVLAVELRRCRRGVLGAVQPAPGVQWQVGRLAGHFAHERRCGRGRGRMSGRRRGCGRASASTAFCGGWRGCGWRAVGVGGGPRVGPPAAAHGGGGRERDTEAGAGRIGRAGGGGAAIPGDGGGQPEGAGTDERGVRGDGETVRKCGLARRRRARPSQRAPRGASGRGDANRHAGAAAAPVAGGGARGAGVGRGVERGALAHGLVVQGRGADMAGGGRPSGAKPRRFCIRGRVARGHSHVRAGRRVLSRVTTIAPCCLPAHSGWGGGLALC